MKEISKIVYTFMPSKKCCAEFNRSIKHDRTHVALSSRLHKISGFIA